MVVCDVEATCWAPPATGARRPDHRHAAEIIEIGAVRLHPDQLTVTDHFTCHVRPERHPALSAFCTELTGITQAQVDAAAPFGPAFDAFMAWVGPADGVDLVAWGPFDHFKLSTQAVAAGRPAPGWRPVDARQRFADWWRWTRRQRGHMGLAAALAAAELAPQGQAHRALDDARNTARLWAHICDPRRASAQAQLVLQVLAAHDPQPIHRGFVSAVDDTARRWYERALKELKRAGAVRVSSGDAHAVLSPRGREAVAALGSTGPGGSAAV